MMTSMTVEKYLDMYTCGQRSGGLRSSCEPSGAVHPGGERGDRRRVRFALNCRPTSCQETEFPDKERRHLRSLNRSMDHQQTRMRRRQRRSDRSSCAPDKPMPDLLSIDDLLRAVDRRCKCGSRGEREIVPCGRCARESSQVVPGSMVDPGDSLDACHFSSMTEHLHDESHANNNPLPDDPRLWSRVDVRTWLESFSHDDMPGGLDVDRFRMNGKALCLMTVDMFAYRVPNGGGLALYKDFQTRLCRAVAIVHHNNCMSSHVTVSH